MAPDARASHYLLQDIEMFEPELTEFFVAQGMLHTRDILLALRDAEGRQVLARSSGIAEARLLETAILLELVQVEGIGPRAARLLLAAEVEGVIDLASRSAPELLARCEQANEGFTYTSVHPSLHHVQGWIHEASSAEIVVSR
jgi:hypothetical protein